MNDKLDLIAMIKASGFSFMGFSAGMIALNERITIKTAVHYALFAIICGPITRIVLTQTPTIVDFRQIILLCAGAFGFFIFKGVMFIFLKWSKNPLKVISEVNDIRKGKK